LSLARHTAFSVGTGQKQPLCSWANFNKIAKVMHKRAADGCKLAANGEEI
jgi:hypothetical protein